MIVKVERILLLSLVIYVCMALQQCDSSPFETVVKDYPFEQHTVTTEDGYILTLFRIQKKGQKQIIEGLKPVFIQHGLMCSADDFVYNEENSVGLYLADQGYDVWFGNNRGNKYSLSHTSLDIKSEAFWDFSFQELGRYDLPANLKYVTQTTGFAKISYIGHSQGTSQMFAALGDPETSQTIQGMVDIFFAMAPIVYLANETSSTLRDVVNHSALIIEALKIFGIDYIGAGDCSLNSKESEAKALFCTVFQEICDDFLLIADADPIFDNTERFPTFMKHFPAGASTRQFYHYRQFVMMDRESPVFQRYDFGTEENKKRYGQKTPPPFDLSLAKGSIIIKGLEGNGDQLGDLADNKRLWDELAGYGVNYEQILFRDTGHGTFMWAKDMSKMLQYIDGQIQSVTNATN